MKPVLVVDDDESYRELVTVTLEDHCAAGEVVGFSGGRALLRHLADHPGESALALLDLHMPDVSGAELVREIRRLDPQLPIAFLSGSADEDERAACLAAGAMAFLRKPVAYAQLVRSLQELVASLPGRGAG